jgi:hypothetical protein
MNCCEYVKLFNIFKLLFILQVANKHEDGRKQDKQNSNFGRWR